MPFFLLLSKATLMGHPAKPDYPKMHFGRSSIKEADNYLLEIGLESVRLKTLKWDYFSVLIASSATCRISFVSSL